MFAAASSELLPSLLRQRSVQGTLAGGALGVLVMLGIAFVSGERAGLLPTIALTIEILALPVTIALQQTSATRLRIIATATVIALLLPLSAMLGSPVAAFNEVWLAGVFAFGLMGLFHLVTEELFAEAHETPEKPWITATFFAGCLLLILIEELAPLPVLAL